MTTKEDVPRSFRDCPRRDTAAMTRLSSPRREFAPKAGSSKHSTAQTRIGTTKESSQDQPIKENEK